jgi:hypothetical protein
MSMVSLMNCTEGSQRRNRPRAGMMLQKFETLAMVGTVLARGVGLGLPALSFPRSVKSRANGEPNPAFHVLRLGLTELVTNPDPGQRQNSQRDSSWPH